ncbi:MAG: S-layer homology domain-containing protein [Evtepia sp.]|nr:S-layer homology domain-containing protein [Evtepia sp.]
MSKKILAILMAVAMAFSLLPVTALAGNTSLLSITPPNEGKFATYEFYTSDDAQSPWYTQTVKTGDMLNPPADPTLAGSHFTGWKTADGKEVPFGTVTVKETSIIKCYAKWEENKNPIHVYFMAAIGSNEVMHTGVAQNGAVDIPPDYQDITWKTEKNETFDRTNVTKDMKVYPASASCWLTFDSQGGSAVASHYVQQDQAFDLSKVSKPKKAGYIFAGWSLTTDGASVTQVTPTQDTKLYALWTPTTTNYTVIHWQENANDNEYSYIASEKKSGTTGTQTNATSKQYDGFEAKTITQKNINGDGSTIVNVYYQRNSYTIHFYYKDKGKWKEYTDIRITAKYGADISSQWPEKKNSKTWSTTKPSLFNDGPYQANIQTMPLGGAKYYGPKTGTTFESAQYYVEVLPGESGAVTQGDVTYKLHHTDTTPGSRLKVTDEDKYPLTGFTYKEGTSNGKAYNNAEFYYTRNSYAVVYISNGVEVQKNTYKYQQDISSAGNYKPDNAPTGYTFGGWCSDPSEMTPYDFSSKTMPAQNITVYAKWVPITLTLTIEGVDGVGSGDVSYNQVINRANVYTDATTKLAEANETVLYWVNCETNQKEDVNRQMTTNLTIRPVLKGDTYTVTYSGDATTTKDPYAYWHGTTAKVQDYTGEKANKFLYWTDAANTTTKYHPGDQIRMTANVTLTPKFSEETPGQTYSVTYHSNFGTGQEYTPTESIKNNDLFTIKAYKDTKLPNREDYEFKEWNTKSDGTGKTFEAGSSARMNGANDNDLYAQWQPCTYTLTYDANGGQFGSGDSAPPTKQESEIPAGDHSLNYSQGYIPNHAQSGDKDVVFIGWSTDNNEKIYDKGEDIPTLIKSIQMDGNKTVYAVWGYDAIGENGRPDGVPDVFNAVVTYNIVGGTWDGTHASATEVIKVKELKNGVWENTGNKLKNIPYPTRVTPDANHTLPGSWGKDLDSTPTTNTVVTADKIYTYTLSEVTTGTLTITKKVEGDGLTVDSLPENFQITVKDAQGETKGTLTKTEEAKKADGTLTWTIRDLPAGEYTVSESNADVTGYTYTDTYTSSKNTDTGKSVTVEVNATSTMTVTNTYTKNATVNLSQLIQKQLTVKKDSTLPTGTTFNVTVTPKTVNNVNVDTPQPIPGTVSNLETGTTNEAGDTIYTASFDFKTKNTLSLPAGTYTYTVQENATSPISGMQYDSNVYTLTIEVENSKASVKYTTKEGTTPTEVSTTNPLTIQNTYQAPDLTVEKKTVSVAGEPVNNNNPVAHVGEQIIWSVTVTNKNSTPAHVTLTDAMAEGVYTNQNCEEANKVTLTNDNSWTATVSGTPVTYYVTYTVKADDIPKGEIVNTIVKDGDNNNPINSDPVSTWDTKQLKSAKELDTSDWTTTVTLTLPKVNGNKEGTPVITGDAGQEPEVTPIIAISKGSYVIDKIGKQFTFMDGLSLEKNNVKIPRQKKGDTYYFGENATEQSYLYKLTYTAQNGEEAAQFKWEINENIPAETTVTLSYKLKLTNPKTGTYGVKDLNGDGKVDDTGATYTENGEPKPLYTNESATMVPKDSNGNEGETLTFPKPSVFYTVSSGSSGSHSGGSRPSLNTKDHYGYIIGYPVDYYTGQPTTDQTKKPVRPEGKITRAEVATIYFRMLTDESRTKFWSQSSGYSDVKTGDWFNNAVSTLSNAGIIAGYEDGSFRPNGYITRAEFATIAARFFDVTYNGKDLFPDISGHWAKDYINQAANKGFVNGYEDGTFKPDRNITRAEAVTLVNRTLDRHPDKNHFTKDMLVWPDNMDQTKWYYADMQEATNSHTYQMKENSDKTKYENWTKTLPIRNWEALEKAWSNANSSQGNGNVV